MGFEKFCKIIFTANLLIVLGIGNAFSESTDWMSWREAGLFIAGRELNNNKIPTKIVCKEKNIKINDFEPAAVKIYYRKGRKNEKNKKWYISGGNRFGIDKRMAQKNGFKLVSYSSFIRRKSKLLIKCGIWHK